VARCDSEVGVTRRGGEDSPGARPSYRARTSGPSPSPCRAVGLRMALAPTSAGRRSCRSGELDHKCCCDRRLQLQDPIRLQNRIGISCGMCAAVRGTISTAGERAAPTDAPISCVFFVPVLIKNCLCCARLESCYQMLTESAITTCTLLYVVTQEAVRASFRGYVVLCRDVSTSRCWEVASQARLSRVKRLIHSPVSPACADRPSRSIHVCAARGVRLG
jgi:hypothetical protein